MRQVDAYAHGNPQLIREALELSWEDFYMWLANQYRKAVRKIQ